MKYGGLAFALALTVCSGAFGQTTAEQHVEAARRAVQDAEKSGKEDARLGAALTELGLAYTAQRQFAEAEPVLQRAIAVKEKFSGTRTP
jgi:tetratricopeptide (TPR) repeat protein